MAKGFRKSTECMAKEVKIKFLYLNIFITIAKKKNLWSNITETVAQLLISHALGPNDVFHESINLISTECKHGVTPKNCHNCPKGLLPFHITPHPQLACERGTLHPCTKDEMDPAVVSHHCKNARVWATVLIIPSKVSPMSLKYKIARSEVRHCSYA